jgi:glycosyltransferase involved in cell wall biosynthesis
MNILFDCERMKYPHVGLFYYCMNLAKNLAGLIRDTCDSFTCYYPSSLSANYIGKDVPMLYQRDIHKILFPSTRKYDIWHCTEQRSAYHPKNKKLRKVLTVHDLNFLHEPDVSMHKIRKNLKTIQRNIDYSDSLIAISNFVKQDIETYLDVKKPVTVIYNGVPAFPLKEVEKPAFAPSSPFLFSVGVVHPKKNFHVLPRLLVGNDYRLVISGTIPDVRYARQITEEATRLQVSDRVILTGAISENDKQWCYTACEAFVFPSLAEGFGLPVVEAMSFGKPVFLSQATSLPEVGGAEAYYFDSFEPASMSSVLMSGMEKYKDNMIEKSMALKQRASLFSWENCARNCLAVYREILK